jgi:hypothetical protein
MRIKNLFYFIVFFIFCFLKKMYGSSNKRKSTMWGDVPKGNDIVSPLLVEGLGTQAYVLIGDPTDDNTRRILLAGGVTSVIEMPGFRMMNGRQNSFGRDYPDGWMQDYLVDILTDNVQPTFPTNYVLQGRYYVIGNICHVQIYYAVNALTGTPADGSNTTQDGYIFTLPEVMADDYWDHSQVNGAIATTTPLLGTGGARDPSASTEYDRCGVHRIDPNVQGVSLVKDNDSGTVIGPGTKGLGSARTYHLEFWYKMADPHD